MIDTILLAVISTLLALVGTLALIGYKDIARRIVHIEEGYRKTNAAIITIALIMIQKQSDTDSIAKVLNGLMSSL